VPDGYGPRATTAALLPMVPNIRSTQAVVAIPTTQCSSEPNPRSHGTPPTGLNRARSRPPDCPLLNHQPAERRRRFRDPVDAP